MIVTLVTIYFDGTAEQVYYCCNTNGIWKDTECHAHIQDWCKKGDAGMNCLENCEYNGFRKGSVIGTEQGEVPNRVRCLCEQKKFLGII